jgi:hypothetical protein
MLKRSLSIAIILIGFACSSIAAKPDDLKTTSREQSNPRAGAVLVAQSLFEEVVSWICENFDLPITQNRPNIRFATKAELTLMRILDRTQWDGFVPNKTESSAERHVVAVYDTQSQTIYLPENWSGKSAADQSILVHEMVHHLQKLAGMRFECPAAREKVAYLAQDKWLERFGLSLEREFELDMFTVVVSSACM